MHHRLELDRPLLALETALIWRHIVFSGICSSEPDDVSDAAHVQDMDLLGIVWRLEMDMGLDAFKLLKRPQLMQVSTYIAGTGHLLYKNLTGTSYVFQP